MSDPYTSTATMSLPLPPHPRPSSSPRNPSPSPPRLPTPSSISRSSNSMSTAMTSLARSRRSNTLIPKIQTVVSNSPSAIDKLEDLTNTEDLWGAREKNESFEKGGFECFVVEGQRGKYTVLKTIREVDHDAFDNLPALVYTVISTVRQSQSGTRQQLAWWEALWTALLHRTPLERNTINHLVANEKKVVVTENWVAGGKEGGVLMAINAGLWWEVKVEYEDKALNRAMEAAERGEERMRWR
ncbi:hypothetical protein EJ02DRAFT_463841 [Clathrospora elynae]|uniref:Uncharacterized protein n=1 Tax=Clathrospora elynae TaxID=706981 RepID=A0A6A5SXR7_9PLEO|nr:hypothetical protein EJ02DRAFT_463841 [Clathrospora elynae]